MVVIWGYRRTVGASVIRILKNEWKTHEQLKLGLCRVYGMLAPSSYKACGFGRESPVSISRSIFFPLGFYIPYTLNPRIASIFMSIMGSLLGSSNQSLIGKEWRINRNSNA